jgi:hypothetical protein
MAHGKTLGLAKIQPRTRWHLDDQGRPVVRPPGRAHRRNRAKIEGRAAGSFRLGQRVPHGQRRGTGRGIPERDREPLGATEEAVVWHATTTLPWARKARRRRANAIARQSRKANRS